MSTCLGGLRQGRLCACDLPCNPPFFGACCCGHLLRAGLDSLDTVEVVMAIEEEFTIEIPDDQAEKLLSISDAVEFIAAHPQAK